MNAEKRRMTKEERKALLDAGLYDASMEPLSWKDAPFLVLGFFLDFFVLHPIRAFLIGLVVFALIRLF